MVYHIISKTLRGQFLLAPKKGVSSLCGGVVAMARQNWPEVKLYGFAFMSNHIHLMVSGGGNDVSGFVAAYLEVSITVLDIRFIHYLF